MENLLIVSDTDVFMHSFTLIYCKGFDGQVFRYLNAGTYTLFIEAIATENMNEVAYNIFGPVLLTVGPNANISEAIGKNCHTEYIFVNLIMII